MDNQRLLIWAFFGFTLFLTWQAWLEDYGPAQTPSAPAATDDGRVPADVSSGDSLPELPAQPELALEPAPAAAPAAEPPASSSDALVRVETDVLDLTISTRGGTLQRAVLKNYPVAKDRPDELVQLLSAERRHLGVVQMGVRSGVENWPGPNHRVIFDAEAPEYRLAGGDELVVPLTWTDDRGLKMERRYRFRRGSYIIEVEQRLSNQGSEDWRGGSYTQLHRRSNEPERSMFDVDTYSFDGPLIYDGEKSEKLDRDDLMSDGPYEIDTTGGWVAAIQHHFLTAVVPPGDRRQAYRISVSDNVMTAIGIDATQTVAAGTESVFNTTLFVGPKLQAQLEDVDETLKLAVDYGWLTIISQPLFWLLSLVFGYVRNWGLAIIAVTILIKLAFYKLTEASGRSMARMREIQPRMKALQDRYKDDRQALSQAMMDLYKREKVNPAAGCLPILIQMPFFLAFYWVLLESVEMRQAPFALWITDLSSRDPYFILPLIMGAAMLFQQKLNPAPADPVQARVMQIMPIMFTGFFAFFPSGLVLYWVTNTLLSIAQQWHINKVVAAENKQPRKSGKK